ncbi:DUF4145 domain-containing protein [Bacillus pumilus]|uniref:DUF4145 domain-containing protein n=1 Tax=Bacillus pumilus TaxID=1408 RepID=UPI00273D091B|nr:DUF4145 domain-containing protein [Bacillus pumilus]WLP58537.1 DUF4145 domain-containing protein [Bacillus pumilus]
MESFYYENYFWADSHDVEKEKYTCGYCNSLAAPTYGYLTHEYIESERKSGSKILICPNCRNPTHINGIGQQFPPISIIKGIRQLPENIQDLYKEVCDSFSVNAFTGASILARKMIMNIAIEKGDKKDKSFIQYVEFLVNEGIVPKSAEKWLDAVRLNGNIAAHNIEKSTKEETQKLIDFLEMLLRIVYEFEAEL